MMHKMKEHIQREVANSLLEKYLKTMGINITDPNFIQTPDRIYRMHKEMFYGMTEKGKKEIDQILTKTFPSLSNDMVVFSPLKVVTLCPHHLLTVHLTCHVAYIPKGNKVIGLSKIPRLVELLAKQPILQEDLLHLITNTLHTKTKNSGVYVILIGRHGCMCDRGAKTTARAGNAAVRGNFIKPEVKAEALSIIEILNKENNGK